MVMMKLFFPSLLSAAVLLLASACTTDHASLSLSRDSRFTGRGNTGETLLELTLLPDGPCRVLAVDVTLEASSSDVSRDLGTGHVSARIDGYTDNHDSFRAG